MNHTVFVLTYLMRALWLPVRYPLQANIARGA